MVLPEPVGAATSTDCPASSASRARSWNGSRVNGYPASKPARSCATVKVWPNSSGGGGLLATLGDFADDDRRLVEDAHRYREGNEAVRIAARRGHCHHDEDRHDRAAPRLREALRRDRADELEGHEHDGEQEPDPKADHQQDDERDVFALGEEGLDVA